MSNNSCPCPEGGEIGRAQAAQAEACGLLPEPDMNPILLKPLSDTESQVVVQGQVWKNLPAAEYFAQHDTLAPRVAESFERLRARYDFVVAEGAGGLAEVNLRSVDLTNLGLAAPFNLPILLVADVDRGGALASVFGTLGLLDPPDAGLVRGFVLNRFRGDPALLADGVTLLEQRTERPCLGVFPHAPDIHLDEEDGPLTYRPIPRPAGLPRIAALRFPRISNLTDFRLLPWTWWLSAPTHEPFDIIILPGTKNTAADLEWMRERGLDQWLLQRIEQGAKALGVCGGYQMLGESIDDPHALESDRPSTRGLGVFPIRTELQPEKITRAVQARTPNDVRFNAYEIHKGRTARPSDAEPLAYIDGRPEGLRRGRVMGTYLHGALENAAVIEAWLGFRPPAAPDKQVSYDQLADWFDAAVDHTRFDELFL